MNRAVEAKLGVKTLRLTCLSLAIGACLPTLAFSQGCKPAHSEQDPVASLGNQPIFLNQASPALQGQLQRLRQAEFELERKSIDEIIAKQLLAGEAKKNGQTVEDLLARNVDAKIEEPTAEELKAYSLARGKENGSVSDDLAVVRESFRKAEIREARQQFIDQLRTHEQISIILRPPTIDITCDTGRTLGRPDSPINIIEFSDFSCPYCKRAERTLKQLLEKYGQKASLSYRDFPLVQLHPYAKTAAEASRCALERGKFWEYHDLLLASTDELEPEVLIRKARELGIDEHEFGSCLFGGKYRSDVDRDLDDGTRAGVQTTPAFFINGIYLSGAQPIEAFEKVIESELANVPESATRVAGRE